MKLIYRWNYNGEDYLPNNFIRFEEQDSPKGSIQVLSGFNSYWYIPKNVDIEV